MGIGETAREVGKLAQENEKKEQVPNYRRPRGLGISGLKMWGRSPTTEGRGVSGFQG